MSPLANTTIFIESFVGVHTSLDSTQLQVIKTEEDPLTFKNECILSVVCIWKIKLFDLFFYDYIPIRIIAVKIAARIKAAKIAHITIQQQHCVMTNPPLRLN